MRPLLDRRRRDLKQALNLSRYLLFWDFEKLPQIGVARKDPEEEREEPFDEEVGRQDIIEQREDFLEYAEERGAYVAGASSVQGEAPKYLLAEDRKGMFHADGALPDDEVKRFWLVKFPLGRRTDERNRQVLRNEAPYLEVARKFGVRADAPPVHEDGVLFVPRFDREAIDGRVGRLGMHSLYAIAGIPGYGATVRHDVYCRVIARVVTAPALEIREYLLRDILNLALRNTDNHGRNTALLRRGDRMALSPLFDFTPMFLDPEGIGCVSRWEDERPGSLLIATDGLWEAKNRKGEMFSIERVRQVLASWWSKSAQELCDLLLSKVQRFAGKGQLDDDASLMIIKIESRPQASPRTIQV